MAAEHAEYPEPWRTLPLPAIRQRVIDALEDIARDPTTGLNWPPPDARAMRSINEFSDILDEWGMFDCPAEKYLGWSLLDQAEVDALDRFIAALRKVLGEPTELISLGEAYWRPEWPAVAHAAHALRTLMVRWGIEDYALAAALREKAQAEQQPAKPKVRRSFLHRILGRGPR